MIVKNNIFNIEIGVRVNQLSWIASMMDLQVMDIRTFKNIIVICLKKDGCMIHPFNIL